MDYFGLAVALLIGAFGFAMGWGARETKMLSDSTKAMNEWLETHREDVK